MIRVRPDQLEEFANRLSTDVALRAGQRTTIRNYVLANMVGMSNEQIVVALAMPVVTITAGLTTQKEVGSMIVLLNRPIRLKLATASGVGISPTADNEYPQENPCHSHPY